MWIGTVQGLQSSGLLGDMPEGAEAVGGAWTIDTSTSLVRIPADQTGDPLTGQAYLAGSPGILVPLPTVEEKPLVQFKVAGRAIRKAPRTDAASRQQRPSLRDLWGRRKRKRQQRP